jgi:hypothetical protein
MYYNIIMVEILLYFGQRLMIADFSFYGKKALFFKSLSLQTGVCSNKLCCPILVA